MNIEDRLRQSFSRRVEHLSPPRDAWNSIERRIAGQRRRAAMSRLLVTGVTLATFAGGFAWLWMAFRGPEETARRGAGTAPRANGRVNLEPQVTAKVPVGAFPRAVAAGEEGVWVAVQPQAECDGSVVHLDPQSNQVVATIAVDALPQQVAVGRGSAWVVGVGCSGGGGEGVVLRIDGRSGDVLATIPIGMTPVGVAVDENGVWVSRDIDGYSGELVRLDPDTNEIVARIPLEGRIRDVAVGADAVWVVDSTSTLQVDPSIIRIDPERNQVAARLSYGSLSMAVGQDYVWVDGLVSGESVALRIDPRTNDIMGDPIPVKTVFRPFAVGEGGVWFLSGPGRELPTSGSGAICRLSTETLEVDECVDPGPVAQEPLDPPALDVEMGTIWVANNEDSVTRIDLR